MVVCYKIVDTPSPQTIIHTPKPTINLEERYTEFKGYILPMTTSMVERGKMTGVN